MAPPTVRPPTNFVSSGRRFDPILVNCGGLSYTDVSERNWKADYGSIGGKTYSKMVSVEGTKDDYLYSSERHGEFKYRFIVPIAEYKVIFHFVENYREGNGKRVFGIKILGKEVLTRVDVFQQAGGKKGVALTLEETIVVSDADGVLEIEFVKKIGLPMLCALEIIMIAPHLAHAVAGGPYTVVDADGDGKGVVKLDGTQSHTHAVGQRLVEWTWTVYPFLGVPLQIAVANTEKAEIKLDHGIYDLILAVKDDGGNKSLDLTRIEVLPPNFASVSSISPATGSVNGGDSITIIGSGFTYAAAETIVYFGSSTLTGNQVTVVNPTKITLLAPLAAVATPVAVSVETPLGKSNSVTYVYIDGTPIDFDSQRVLRIFSPTSLAFGPDEKLYVSTSGGIVAKYTLDDDYNVLDVVTSTVVADLPDDRMILGIALDPMDTSDNPALYVSHSHTFHGSPFSTSGGAISGRVSKLSGANLDVLEDVVTGLPVSDHDHAVNGMEFGDNGELYIQVAGNTNSGVTGRLSTTRQLKDSVLSASTVVAYLSDPKFDGKLVYDAKDDGNLVGGYGVEVFAYGQRNSYDIVLHSNGKLYATDNGPDKNFGDRANGCGPGEQLDDLEEDDKINWIQRGKYYGQPNRKRGQTDPRQCFRRNVLDPGTSEYTAPLVVAPSSIDGITEFQSDHFGGQLRGNLIVSKYKKSLYRVILNSSGTSVLEQSNPPIELVGNHGLDVTQGPDGSLFDCRYLTGDVFVHKPKEAPTQATKILSVFPRRGKLAGGSVLSIHGVNLNAEGTPTIKVGAGDCRVKSATIRKVTCFLPSAVSAGTVDIALTTGARLATFRRGYRYITGTR